MRMDSIFHHKPTSSAVILGLAVGILLHSVTAFAGESKIIGYSNRSDATAQSNGRRMIRTSDDRRILVYQDSLDGKPVIQWIHSNDGRRWSSPAVMANGSFPALAVSDENWIYLVWCLDDQQGLGVAYSTDGATTWAPSIEIRPEAMAKSRFPAIEATTQAVHIVWQQEDLTNAVEKISYQRFSKDLSEILTPMLVLSAEGIDSRFPVIASDLEFKADFLHLVWCEYPPQGLSRIVYCNMLENREAPNRGFTPPVVVPKTSGKSNPSLSVSHFKLKETPSAFITMACVDPNAGRLMTILLYANSDGIQSMRTDSIAVGLHSSTSVDDIYLSSCAIVWQSSGHIYYGQTRDERIMTKPPLRVCNDGEAHCKNPNVCYKTFRRDSIDVVWTDGDHAPYHIMYRRLAKEYGPVAVDGARRTQLLPKDFFLLQNYPNPFNPETEIRFVLPEASNVVVKIFNLVGEEIRTLVDAPFHAGHHIAQWDGKDKIGNAIASGVYLYRLQAGSFSCTKKMILLR